MQILFDILRGDYYRKQKQTQSSLDIQGFSDKKMKPRLLWISCSDIYLSPHLAIGLQPGEIVMHHNIANQIKSEDASVQSVIQYTVETLGVNRIVVCGHYQCSSIRAALQAAEEVTSGETPISEWMQDLRELAFGHWSSLRAIPTLKERANRLAELNVLTQAERLRHNKFVSARQQGLQVFSWMFDSEKGIFTELSSVYIIKRQPITNSK